MESMGTSVLWGGEIPTYPLQFKINNKKWQMKNKLKQVGRPKKSKVVISDVEKLDMIKDASGQITNTQADIQDELSNMDSFKDYLRYGNNSYWKTSWI